MKKSINQQVLFIATEKPQVKGVIQHIRNYLAGQAIGITRDEALLEEVLKILFCLSILRKEKALYVDIKDAFSKIKVKYPEFYGPKEKIILDETSVTYTVNQLNLIFNSNAKDIDLVGDCYEIFIGNQIRGQEGQFFTPKVAVDFLINAIQPTPDQKIIDTACGASGFLSSLYIYFRDKYSEAEAKKFVKNNLYGIEKDHSLARLGKIHLALLSGEMPKIYAGDSLTMKGDPELNKVKNIEFDIVMTNPPFGKNIISVDKNTQAKYELGYRWHELDNEFLKSANLVSNVPPQVVFTERNIKALKEGGILATVVPESLISNKNYRHVVSYILNNCKVLAVVGMPESLFKTSGKGGTHTKTALMILKKEKEDEIKNYKLFMAEAKWCGHDSRGNTIPNNDLPEVLENYLKNNFGYTEFSSLGYKLKKDEVQNYILAPRYYDYELEKLLTKLSKGFDLVKIKDLVDQNIISIKTGDEVGKLSYGTGKIPFIRTSDLSNWEIKSDPKHYISENTYDKVKIKQDIREGDVLMVKDGTYLIGTVAIITPLDTRIVYQSHMYKIRVNSNSMGLTPYNLLGLLSSDFLQRQIKSKQLTQDIIDSLGRRVYELLVPIPKDTNKLRELDEAIRSVIQLKIKVKEAVRKPMKILNQDFS